MPAVLGISGYYHDSAAAIVRDGRIVAAAQEERFSRIKGDARFPAAAIRFCLDEAQIEIGDLDWVAYYEKPLLTFDRLIETYLGFAPVGFRSFAEAMPVWVKEKLFLGSDLVKQIGRLERGRLNPDRLVFGYHHHSHAASAFYPSPFGKAAILVVDGVGEWATCSIGSGEGDRINLLREIRFPHSLGLLYAAFTYYLGFKVNDGEYKVMGLAPYGEPRYAQLILDRLIDLKPDGSFRLDLTYFDYCTGLRMTGPKFEALFGMPRRLPDAALQPFHMDVARSIQAVTEEVMIRLVRTARSITGLADLCLAGGVALNCVANGRILREGIFDRLWIQPAAGDAGGAIGAALATDHVLGQSPRRWDSTSDGMSGCYLGPSFDSSRIRAALNAVGACYHVLDEDEMIKATVQALIAGKVVGWFQGRMEYGPRALGNRSILADPRSPDIQRMLNMKIKYRESFRPFAPAVLREDVARYFEFDGDSPYMLLVADVRPERRRQSTAESQLTGLARLRVPQSDIPAVTHVDGSARIQTVHKDTNPRFYRLLEGFRAETRLGVLVNTSFNVRDEPIVCTPEDAWRCFMGSEMDVLVMDRCMLHKDEQ